MKTLINGLTTIVLFTLLSCTGRENPAADGAQAIKDLSKKTAIEKITPEVIASLADKDLEQAIFDNVSGTMEKDSSKSIDEKVKSLTAGQRAIYVTWVVEAEVNHGGFQQFYDNAGKLAEVSVEGFTTISAPQFAELMRQANAIYKDISSGNRKVRGGVDPYDALEDLYLKTYKTEPLDLLKVKYIRANPTEFSKSE